MAFAFDTLGYSKHLQDAGVARGQADAHAEAARNFVMNELVTKTDMALALDNLTYRLTIRLGSMIAAGIAALAVLERLH